MNWLDRRLYGYPPWRRWRGLPEPMSVSMADLTRECLRILSSKLDFIGTINREYDWPKVSPGGTVRIRMPGKTGLDQAGTKSVSPHDPSARTPD